MDLSKYFQLLSDPTRLRIISKLRQGEICVCDLAEGLKLDQTLVSHHLKKLREVELIEDRKVGRWVHCRLNKQKFAEMGEEYQLLLGAENIKSTPCTEHPGCCPDQNECKN